MPDRGPKVGAENREKQGGEEERKQEKRERATETRGGEKAGEEVDVGVQDSPVVCLCLPSPPDPNF